MPPRPRSGGMIYSTELGRTCPACRQALHLCVCPQNTARILGDGQIRVGRESKGRGGKVVTTVTGVAMNAADLGALATQLKKRCGTGGTLKDGVIEIQGEHRDTIVAHLRTLGLQPKRTGG